MKLGTPRHPKFIALMKALGLTRIQTIGLLELLWAFTIEFAPDGAIGKFPDAVLADAVEWEGDPHALIEALTAERSRWLDRCEVHRLLIHHWPEHAPDYLKKPAQRGQFSFVLAPVQACPDNGGHCPDNGGHCPDNGGHCPDNGGQRLPTMPCHVMPCHAMSSDVVRTVPDNEPSLSPVSPLSDFTAHEKAIAEYACGAVKPARSLLGYDHDELRAVLLAAQDMAGQVQEGAVERTLEPLRQRKPNCRTPEGFLGYCRSQLQQAARGGGDGDVAEIARRIREG